MLRFVFFNSRNRLNANFLEENYNAEEKMLRRMLLSQLNRILKPTMHNGKKNQAVSSSLEC